MRRHPSPTWLRQVWVRPNSRRVCTVGLPKWLCFLLLELSCYNDFVDDQLLVVQLYPLPGGTGSGISDTKKAEKLEIMIDAAMDP